MAMKCARLPAITNKCQMPWPVPEAFVERKEDDAHGVEHTASCQPKKTGEPEAGEQWLDGDEHDPAHDRVNDQ